MQADKLAVQVYANRDLMGAAAAEHVADRLVDLLERKDTVRIVVGSAPSQDDFFRHLTGPAHRDRIDWSRMCVFHMDEYIGLASDHPQNFRAYQREHLLARVDVGTFHEIRGESDDPEGECERISALIAAAPIDIVCLGIGENGHLAFNDPPVEFAEEAWAKIVSLDAVCRQQQVNDGCFPAIDEVPRQAITLSMRVFREAGMLSGVVPAPTKANAVAATVNGPVSPNCPATLMRTHKDATLFLDADAAALI